MTLPETAATVPAPDPEAGPWPTSQCLRSCHLFDRIGDAVLVAELPSTRVALWNAAASHLFGYPEGEPAQLRLVDLMPGWPSSIDGARARTVELLGRHRDGRGIELEASFGSLEGGGSPGTFVLVILRDITELKRTHASLSDRAFHDALTGLPNRLLLTDRFRQAAVSARRAGSQFAVVMLDLDGFKSINDQLGHVIGDAVLRQVAQRLSAAVRESDTVARFGGDEFLLLLSMPEGNGGAEHITERILRTFALPITASERTVHVHASAGVAIFPEHGADMERLIERADAAMYQAKRRGGGYELFGRASARPPVTEPVRGLSSVAGYVPSGCVCDS